MHVREGFCDVILESKKELEEKQRQADLQKFQQQRLKDIEGHKNQPIPKLEEAKLPLVRPTQMPVNPQPLGSSLADQNVVVGDLTEEDQMIFNQYYNEDDSEMLA